VTRGFRLRDPRQLLALGLGVGLVPGMPGTAGSALAIPLIWALAPLTLSQYLLVILVTFALGCWFCDRAARAVGVHDHPAIVWDEIVGMLIATIAVPPHWLGLLGAFVLFRIFDIAKPWPIQTLDRRLSGGFGIMLDDAIAGAAALIVWHGLDRLLAILTGG